jgi:hypothetical protein
LVLQITNKKKLSDVFVILIYSGTIPTKALTFTNENEFLVLEVAKVKLVSFFGYCFSVIGSMQQKCWS